MKPGHRSILMSVKKFLFLSFFFSVATFSYAANPVAPFSPNDNVLDPWCLPTDSNCYVSLNNITLANATATTLYTSLLRALTASISGTTTIATNGGSVGIGTTTPSSKLGIVGGVTIATDFTNLNSEIFSETNFNPHNNWSTDMILVSWGILQLTLPQERVGEIFIKTHLTFYNQWRQEQGTDLHGPFKMLCRET